MSSGDPHADLLERATAALEGIERTSARQIKAFDDQAKAFDRQAKAFERQEKASDAQVKAFERQEKALDDLSAQIRADRAESREHHERMMRRFERSEKIFVKAIGDIDISMQRTNERLEQMGHAISDMADSIRANTQAVLSVLDRLGPATG